MHADYRAALAILETFRTNSSRVQAVKKVGKQMLDPGAQEAFNDLMKEVLAYAEQRNKIAHNLWGVKDGEPDVVYRMPMTAISNFVVEAPEKPTYNAEELAASFRAQMQQFTVADLEQLEQRGRDVLHRVMTETTQKGYARAVEKQNPSASV